MAEIVCPKCRTVIDTNERCTSKLGVNLCMEKQGHDGFHWTDVGGVTYVRIWTGIYAAKSCPGRIDLTRWCQKEPGHDGMHNDGQGMSFSDPIKEKVNAE